MNHVGPTGPQLLCRDFYPDLTVGAIASRRFAPYPIQFRGPDVKERNPDGAAFASLASDSPESQFDVTRVSNPSFRRTLQNLR